ncbi:MAG: hypothetical protein ABL930_12740 [Pseudobdellovibrio sp.]
MNFLILIFTFIFSFGSAFAGTPEQSSFRKNVCQKFHKETNQQNCDTYKTSDTDILQIQCLAEFKSNGCEEYSAKTSKGMSSDELKKSQDRIVSCSVKDICTTPVNEVVLSCAKGATYDLLVSILSLPKNIYEILRGVAKSTEECYKDNAYKAQILEKFNMVVQDPRYQFPEEMFELSFLENLNCSELESLIWKRENAFIYAMGPLIAQGKIKSPVPDGPAMSELIKKGAEELGVRLNCLKPEVQAEVACEIAASALLGPAILSKLKYANVLKYKLADKSFIESGAKYKTTPMQAFYRGEEVAGVTRNGVLIKPRYLNQKSLEKFEVEVVGGKLKYKVSGQILDTKNQPVLYVMDKDGKIYAGLKHGNPELQFNHSSYLSGGEVAAAGELKTKNGVITQINRKSGHYLPSTENLDQVVREFSNRGLNLRSSQISYSVDLRARALNALNSLNLGN